jgi:hypothetical protein
MGGAQRKVLAFLKRSGAKAGLVLAKRNKGGRERNEAKKWANSFQAKGKGF